MADSTPINPNVDDALARSIGRLKKRGLSEETAKDIAMRESFSRYTSGGVSSRDRPIMGRSDEERYAMNRADVQRREETARRDAATRGLRDIAMVSAIKQKQQDNISKGLDPVTGKAPPRIKNLGKGFATSSGVVTEKDPKTGEEVSYRITSLSGPAGMGGYSKERLTPQPKDTGSVLGKITQGVSNLIGLPKTTTSAKGSGPSARGNTDALLRQISKRVYGESELVDSPAAANYRRDVRKDAVTDVNEMNAQTRRDRAMLAAIAELPRTAPGYVRPKLASQQAAEKESGTAARAEATRLRNILNYENNRLRELASARKFQEEKEQEKRTNAAGNTQPQPNSPNSPNSPNTPANANQAQVKVTRRNPRIFAQFPRVMA